MVHNTKKPLTKTDGIKRNTAKAEEARDKARRLRAQEEKREKRWRIASRAFIGVLIVATVSVICWVSVKAYHDSKDGKMSTSVDSSELAKGEQLTPKSTDNTGAFHVESAKTNSASVRIDEFFDPICPGCGEVNRQTREYTDKLLSEGKIDLYLTPMAFLDRMSRDRYSTRAVNAFITVFEHDTKLGYEFMNKLFDSTFQPHENGATPSDDMLVELALQVGVPDDIATSIKEHHYVDWLTTTASANMKRATLFPDGFSTPAVFLNLSTDEGKEKAERVSFSSGSVLDVFKTAVDKAIAEKQM